MAVAAAPCCPWCGLPWLVKEQSVSRAGAPAVRCRWFQFSFELRNALNRLLRRVTRNWLFLSRVFCSPELFRNRALIKEWLRECVLIMNRLDS